MQDGFWRGKRVLVTGHTGFKGAWLSLLLSECQAEVDGFALPPATDPSLYEVLNVGAKVGSRFGDVRDRDAVFSCIRYSRPDVIFHLASQPLVRESIVNPSATFTTNVLGIVNVIDAARSLENDVVLVNVTSDKVYDNDNDGRTFVESDRLGGKDPYSASKACAELVTRAYRATVLEGAKLRVSSARAGNVIGGGDWSPDRIVPDIVRSISRGEDVILRYPNATRPWQHVLEPIFGYMQLARAMIERGRYFDRPWNFGPRSDEPAFPVKTLTEAFIHAFGAPIRWRTSDVPQPPEMQTLGIDSSDAIAQLGWEPRLSTLEAIDWTASWYAAFQRRSDPVELTRSQMQRYLEKVEQRGTRV